MKTTDIIINLQKQKLPNKLLNKFSSVLASFFSIVFSMSIIKEATKFINEKYIIFLLVIFIILFLVFNEYRKVMELRSLFYKRKYSLFIIILTFIVSFSLSGIGIYLWTNKSLESEVKNDEINVSEKFSIESRYNTLLDSISSISVSKTDEYQRLNIDLLYWKNRKAANLEERSYIREQIQRVQNDISNFNVSYNQLIKDKINRLEEQKQAELNKISSDFKHTKLFISRANKISFIFFIMVIVTELIIILLAKENSEQNKKEEDFSKGNIQIKFIQQYRAITDILLRKQKIGFDDVLYSPYFNFSKSEEERTKEVKSVYYLFGDLKILEMPLDEAQKTIKNYYETILNI